MEPSAAPTPSASHLVYGLEARLPFGSAVLVSLQQVTAMVVGVITPALLLSNILHFSTPDTAYLVSMALVAAAVGTFLQTTRIGPIGSGLLSVTGTSFAFLAPLIQTGAAGGLPLMLGMSLATAPVQLLLAPFMPNLKRAFTPLVSGIVVVLIGLSIIPEAMRGIVEPVAPGAPPWAGGAVAMVVIAAVLIAQAVGRPATRMAGILCGVVAGYATCAICDYLHAPPPLEHAVTLPRLMPFNLAFQWKFFVPFAFIYVVSLLESMGDITATSQLSGLSTDGPEHWSRLRRGGFGRRRDQHFCRRDRLVPEHDLRPE